jgi:hypothetical protein
VTYSTSVWLAKWARVEPSTRGWAGTTYVHAVEGLVESRRIDHNNSIDSLLLRIAGAALAKAASGLRDAQSVRQEMLQRTITP